MKNSGMLKKIMILLVLGVVAYFAYTKREKIKEWLEKFKKKSDSAGESTPIGDDETN